MQIFLVSRSSFSDVVDRWARLGFNTTQTADVQLLDLLNSPVEREELFADAIVLACDRRSTSLAAPTDAFDPASAVELAARLRELDQTVAMPDGRRWSALPIRILTPADDLTEARTLVNNALAHGLEDLHSRELTPIDDYAAHNLKDDIKRYRQRVLDELDNLGFIVSYEAGRYRLGPALKPRPELVGHYYFGPADRRPDHFVTVDRDLVGIQLEVELLEALLNKQDASEGDFQRFFEDHPHFLSTLASPMPHVRLHDTTGNVLIPDFILKPIVASQRDSRWEILDLKKPQAPLIVGRGSRRRLSHEVQVAIRQLRDYGDYFADPRNGDSIKQVLGHRLRKPKLGVLIGRMNETEVESLEIEQGRTPDVKIVTYDEVLEQQKVLVS